MSLSGSDLVEIVQDECIEHPPCLILGRKFRVGDLVQVKQSENSFFGSIAKIIEDDSECVEQYRTSNNCSSDCIIYSLIALHGQQRFECCQSYLVAAQIR